ncbi:MAG: glycine cleavage system protein H [Gemmatimonadota bacterium]|nr:MAG: glycine cleavage system protein H [Gemmatimonadota bacterium]
MDGSAVVESTAKRASAGLLFHPGHVWARIHSIDLVSLGTTDFAVDFVGTLASVSLPRESRVLRQGETAWTLVSGKRRVLSQVTPFGGMVVAVNDELIRDPGLIQRSPYDKGWLVFVRPRDISSMMADMRSCVAYRMWLNCIRGTMPLCLNSTTQPLMQEGKWVSKFGDHLTDVEWRALRRRLFPRSSDVGNAA